MKFFYKGIDYLKREYVETYERVSRWIRIDFNGKGEPYFRFRNRRYKLDNFLRTNSSVYSPLGNAISNAKGEDVILSGYEADEYFKPYFIELSEYADYVRVYQYLGMERSDE